MIFSRNKKNRFKKTYSNLFLVIFLIIGLGGSLFLIRPAQGVHCTCHVVSDTAPTTIFRTAKTAFNAAVDYANKIANVAHFFLKLEEHVNQIITELLKTRLINSLTRETINFIQGKTDGQLKFVVDLNGYLNGSSNYRNLPEAFLAEVESSEYPEYIKESYKNFFVQLSGDLEGSSSVSLKEEPILKKTNNDEYTLDWDNIYGQMFNLEHTKNTDMAILNAYSEFVNKVEEKRKEKELSYLAGQGFAPQTVELEGDNCLVEDSEGNCVMPSSIITTPGKVFSSMIANIADAHIKRIVNANRLEDFIVVIANSFIDKIIGSSKDGGLLAVSMGKFSTDTSDYFEDDSNDKSNSAIEWLMWKTKSKTFLETKLLVTLRELKKCLASKGDSIMIDRVDKQIKDFEARLEKIKKEISVVQNNYLLYTPEKYGSVKAAKEQYIGFEEADREFSEDAFRCAKTSDDDTVTNWVAIKQKSYDIIMQAPGGIIYYIDKFINYYKTKGESSSYWEAKRSYYEKLAEKIHNDIERVRANPLVPHSSVKEAKDEYNNLVAILRNYKSEWEELSGENDDSSGY